jgi:hypothetical protein
MNHPIRQWVLRSLFIVSQLFGAGCSKDAVPQQPLTQNTTGAEICGCPSTWNDGDEPLYYYYRTEDSPVGLLCDQWVLLGPEGGVSYSIISDASECCGTTFARTPLLPPGVAPQSSKTHRPPGPGDLDPVRPPVKPIKPWEFNEVRRGTFEGRPFYMSDPAVKMDALTVRPNSARVEVTGPNAQAVRNMIMTNLQNGKTVNWIVGGTRVFAAPEITLDLQFWGTFRDQTGPWDSLQGHPTVIGGKTAQNGGEFVLVDGKIYINGNSGRWPTTSAQLQTVMDMMNARIPGLISGVR